MATIPKTYDSIFDRFRGNIPLEYLRTLAYRASGMNPNKSTQGSAGLFMISVPVLETYSQKMGETHTPTDLADPVLNTKIAVWVLKNVVNYYEDNNILNENWSDRNYVALLTHGYLCGYNKTTGVGAAILRVKATTPNPTFDAVVLVAKDMQLSPNIYASAFVNFSKFVADTYLGSLRTAVMPSDEQLRTGASTRKGPGLALAALVGIPFIALVFMKKK